MPLKWNIPKNFGEESRQNPKILLFASSNKVKAASKANYQYEYLQLLWHVNNFVKKHDAMNAIALNSSIVAILEKKQELNSLDYNDARYDDIEEELHDLEDDFNDEFGDLLEDALEDVHAKIKSDADILLPTAYLASSLDGRELEEGEESEGVWVESDSFPGVEMRLVLVANPPRILLILSDQERVLWTAE